MVKKGGGYELDCNGVAGRSLGRVDRAEDECVWRRAECEEHFDGLMRRTIFTELD